MSEPYNPYERYGLGEPPDLGLDYPEPTEVEDPFSLEFPDAGELFLPEERELYSAEEPFDEFDYFDIPPNDLYEMWGVRREEVSGSPYPFAESSLITSRPGDVDLDDDGHPIRQNPHTGFDYQLPEGTPAKEVGITTRVIFAGNYGDFGNTVITDDGRKIRQYSHLSQINVSVGDTVKGGDPVGLVGSTGLSTGPHLHYEERVTTPPSDFGGSAADEPDDPRPPIEWGGGDEDTTLRDLRNKFSFQFFGVTYDFMVLKQKSAFTRFMSDLEKKAASTFKKRVSELTNDDLHVVMRMIDNGELLKPEVVDILDDPETKRSVTQVEAERRYQARREQSERLYQAHREQIRREAEQTYQSRRSQSREEAEETYQAHRSQSRREAEETYQSRRSQSQREAEERRLRIKAEDMAEKQGARFEKAMLAAPAPLKPEAGRQGNLPDWSTLAAIMAPQDINSLISQWQGGSLGTGAINNTRLRRYMTLFPIAATPYSFVTALRAIWAGSGGAAPRRSTTRSVSTRVPSTPRPVRYTRPRTSSVTPGLAAPLESMPALGV